MLTTAKTINPLLKIVAAIKGQSEARKPQLLSIRWAPAGRWNPVIVSGQLPARISRRGNCLARLSLLLAFLTLLLIARPAGAQLNGSFTNNGSGWAGVGPLTNGSPSVVTNSDGKTVLRIGVNNGVPGVAGGKVTSTGRNVCTTTISSYCAVYFHADWTPVGNETATVRVSYKSSQGQVVITRTITASGDHVVNAKDQCPSLVQVTFSIDSGGKPVNSTLDISDVSISCDFFDWSTLAVQPPPPYGELRTAAYPLPMSAHSGPQSTDTIVQRLGSGLSPIANPFSSGTNSLDLVFPAQDDTILYKYNPQTGAFENYYRSAGQWYPSGSFGPGDAGFIDSPVPQEFFCSGQYLPLPTGTHPSSGSAFFANPVNWPVLLEDVMGFKPVVGDVVLIFKHNDTNSVPPGTVDYGFMFQPDNFAMQPVIPVGETVQVFFGDPTKVPMTSRIDTGSMFVSAPGGLPEGCILQASDSVGPDAQWKSLMGVADFYSEPATNAARFYRFGFNVPNANLYGFITTTNHAPVQGETLQLAPNGASQTTDNYGRFSFFDVPIGLVDLNVNWPVQVFDPTTSQVAVYTVGLPLAVNVTAGISTVNLKQDVVVQVLQPPAAPACRCKPWCGAMGGTVNGFQMAVLGGGPLPKDCKDDKCVVTITGPGGVNITMSPGGMATFKPAANGVWKVTATVCGITKTSSITLP